MSAPNRAACEALSAAFKVLLDYPELPAVSGVDYHRYDDGAGLVTFLWRASPATSHAERAAAVELLGARLGMTDVSTQQLEKGLWFHKRTTPFRPEAQLSWEAVALDLPGDPAVESAAGSGAERTAVAS